MSLFAWIRSLFGSPRTRDISRLSADATGSSDAIEEKIDVSGGPLKPHHQRRALRDERLLPKVKSPARQFGFTKRKKVMESAEAGRLFSSTMRTRNRHIRDLLADDAMLEKHGLPLWKTEEDVARALGISLKELWFFAIHREKELQPHYVTFALPKRSGGKRLIMAPKRRLKAIQRKLLGLLAGKLPVSEHAHAFLPGKSIRTGAEPHVGKSFVLKLDLENFFPTVTFARVRGLLIAYGYSFPVATTLAVLMTEAERQPVEVDGKVFHVPAGQRHCVQGAPTSPALCNAVVLRLDNRLAGLARKHQLFYTRYADDLTFSGELSRAEMLKLRTVIRHIIEEEGFKVNVAKTKLMGRGTRQAVTGVVVNEVAGLSRQERRRIRAMLHQLGQGKLPADMHARAEGKLAYVSMLNARQAEQLRPIE